MKKTVILSIMMLLTIVIEAGAANRSKREMLDIATKALSTDNVTGRALRAHSLVEPRLEAENDQLAIYSDEVGGFVIVSKRDDVRAVLGRSLSKYDAANIPDGLQWWLEATEASLRSGARASEDADILKVGETVDNFVTTEWDQLSPYNLYCPKDNNGERSVTGCVATAMAMSMHYFKYPAAGTGKGWYSVTTNVEGADPVVDKYDDVAIDGEYKWDEMKDTYTPTMLAKNLATLMFDCGKSVGMGYSANGSGAASANIPHALAYNFSYDSLSVNYYIRDFYTDKDWFTLIRNELEIRRPILYSGQDKDKGGHEFLFTGLNTDGMVYVNWGWSGNANGWYAIDNLYIESQNVDFAYDQDMVLGLNPQTTPAEGLDNTSLMGFFYDYPFSLSTNENNEILLNDFGIANYSWRVFQGTFKMIIETEEEKPDEYVLNFFGDDEYAYINFNIGYVFSEIPSLNELFSEEGEQFKFPAGNYRAYFLSKSLEESNWQLVRKPGGNYYCYFLVAADGTVKVDNENSLTAIRSVTAPTSSAPSAIYSLDGRKVSSPSSSNVVIMRQGDMVRKVLTR